MIMYISNGLFSATTYLHVSKDIATRHAKITTYLCHRNGKEKAIFSIGLKSFLRNCLKHYKNGLAVFRPWNALADSQISRNIHDMANNKLHFRRMTV
jgi:membrane-associated PAP2 superfamily phosphatase